MLKNLFGGKGKGNYYLQLDETQEAKAPEVSEVSETPAAATEVESVAPQETPVAPAAKPSKAKSKSVKTKTAPATVAPAPAPVAKTLDSAELAKQVIAKTASRKTLAQEAPKGFASDNLMPLPTPRRMPGPSLNGFKEMARQAKVPNQ